MYREGSSSSMTGVLIRRKRHWCAYKKKETSLVTVETEMGAIHPQSRNTKDCRQTPETRKRQRQMHPSRLQHGLAATLISDFQPPEL